MDIRTHLIIANKLYEELPLQRKILIKKRNFLYGNIKPDMVSKYKLTKHYREESYENILHKINTLTDLNWKTISSNKAFCNFSQELGVICHFICDFFCVPHNERWEFKHSMKSHLSYEKNLNIKAKNYPFNKNIKLRINPNISIDEFLNTIYISYTKDTSLDAYSKDLQYSYLICYLIISAILDNVFVSYKKSLIVSSVNK